MRRCSAPSDPTAEPLNVVISGPGGVGKGTLVERLVAADPKLWLSRSWTTRARRPAEPADAYHFVTNEEFDARISTGGFLEWVDFLDYRQGTPTPHPPEGADVVFEIDVEGARSILAQDRDTVLVFLDVPSVDEQQHRLRRRGDDDDQVRRRVAKAAEERALADELGMHIVVNDDLDRALSEVARLIEDARVTGSTATEESR